METVLISSLTFDSLSYEQIIQIQIKIMISQIKIQIIETMLITSLFFYSLSVNSFLSDFFHSAREDVNCEVKYIRYIIKCYIILSYMIIYYIYDIIIIITIGL